VLHGVIYRKAECYVSHYPISKHQCARFGLIPNLNSQSSSSINYRDERIPFAAILLTYPEADLS